MTINSDTLAKGRLNDFLVNFRREHGISVKHISMHSGVHRRLLQRYEKGRIALSKGQLINVFLVCRLWLTQEQFRAILEAITQRKLQSKNTVVRKNCIRRHRQVRVRKTPRCLLRMRK